MKESIELGFNMLHLANDRVEDFMRDVMVKFMPEYRERWVKFVEQQVKESGHTDPEEMRVFRFVTGRDRNIVNDRIFRAMQNYRAEQPSRYFEETTRTVIMSDALQGDWDKQSSLKKVDEWQKRKEDN